MVGIDWNKIVISEKNELKKLIEKLSMIRKEEDKILLKMWEVVK